MNRWRHEKVFGVLLNIFGASTQEELHSILTAMPIQELLERAKVLQQYDLIVDPIFDNDFFTGKTSTIYNQMNDPPNNNFRSHYECKIRPKRANYFGYEQF